jgi:hypothetical protein
MVTGLKRQSGLLLGLTGYLHIIVGFIVFWNPLKEIVNAGIFNAVGQDYPRAAAIWFLFSGLFMVFLAFVIGWVVKTKGLKLPSSVGWCFLAICVAGVILMPVSGFWLGIPQAYLIIKK